MYSALWVNRVRYYAVSRVNVGELSGSKVSRILSMQEVKRICGSIAATGEKIGYGIATVIAHFQKYHKIAQNGL